MKYVAPNIHIVKEQRYITIILSVEVSALPKKIRCQECGGIIGGSNGNVITVFEGRLEDHGRPIDIMCHRCKVITRIL